MIIEMIDSRLPLLRYSAFVRRGGEATSRLVFINESAAAILTLWVVIAILRQQSS